MGKWGTGDEEEAVVFVEEGALGVAPLEHRPHVRLRQELQVPLLRPAVPQLQRLTFTTAAVKPIGALTERTLTEQSLEVDERREPSWEKATWRTSSLCTLIVWLT